RHTRFSRDWSSDVCSSDLGSPVSIQHIQTVFDADTLTGSEKLVLLAYCNYTDPHGYCWPGIDRIADMTGLSRRGVLKIRKQLIEIGRASCRERRKITMDAE